jgi:hypothetical protein
MALDTKEEHENIEVQRRRLEYVSSILAMILVKMGVILDPDLRAQLLTICYLIYYQSLCEGVPRGYESWRE